MQNLQLALERHALEVQEWLWIAMSPTEGGNVPIALQKRRVNGKGGTHLHPGVWTAGPTCLSGLVAGSSRSGLVGILLLRLFLLGLGNCLGVLLILVDSPVEHVVVLKALADEEVAEDLAEIGVVGLVVEAERARVVEVDGELVREAAAEDFSWSGHLLLHDTIVLLLLRRRLEALPGKRATAEVEHDIAKRFHVITTRLLDTKMGVDAGIAGSTSQVLVLSIRDVEMRFRVTILLGKTEVDDIDLITPLADAHEEVVRLDVSVDEGLGMDVLNTRDELIGEKEDRLQRELAVAEVEEVFQAGPEQIEDHGVVITFGAEPAYEGDTDAASQRLVHTGFILELRVLGLDALKLDGNLFARDDVGAKVDVTEAAGANLAANAVLIAHSEVLYATS